MDPATRKEAESWVERVNAIASAVDALLHDDHTSREEDAGSVEEAIIARQKRLAEAEEAAKREEMETKQKEKMEIIKKRYDPKYYARFDRDDYIDQLMQEIEEKEKKSSKDEKRAQAVVMDASVEYTDTERILVEEAAKRKALSNACVAQQAYQDAIGHLDAALVLLANRITLDPLLYATLVNNRSFLWNKLGGYEKAVEDSSEAIRLLSLLAQHSPENSDGTDTTSVKTMLRKAYLRRCVALKCLGRPSDALADLTAIQTQLSSLPPSVEVEALETELRLMERYFILGQAFVEQYGEASSTHNENEANNKALFLVKAVDGLRQVVLHGGNGGQQDRNGNNKEELSILHFITSLFKDANSKLSQGAMILFIQRGGLWVLMEYVRLRPKNRSVALNLVSTVLEENDYVSTYFEAAFDMNSAADANNNNNKEQEDKVGCRSFLSGWLQELLTSGSHDKSANPYDSVCVLRCLTALMKTTVYTVFMEHFCSADHKNPLETVHAFLFTVWNQIVSGYGEKRRDVPALLFYYLNFTEVLLRKSNDENGNHPTGRLLFGDKKTATNTSEESFIDRFVSFCILPNGNKHNQCFALQKENDFLVHSILKLLWQITRRTDQTDLFRTLMQKPVAKVYLNILKTNKNNNYNMDLMLSILYNVLVNCKDKEEGELFSRHLIEEEDGTSGTLLSDCLDPVVACYKDKTGKNESLFSPTERHQLQLGLASKLLSHYLRSIKRNGNRPPGGWGRWMVYWFGVEKTVGDGEGDPPLTTVDCLFHWMEALTNTVQQSKARNKTALLCLDHLSTLLATVCTDPPSDHNDHHQTDWRFESDHVRRETLYFGILTKVVIALAGVGNTPPSAPVSGGGRDTGGAALLISIGNAALTASSILTRYTAPDCPPNSLKHSLKEEMITKDHFKIVKQLLEALRQIHNESGYPRQAKSHWSSCLKNVSILLSKVIALDTEALHYFRELNGFETLLACHKQTA